MEVQSHSLFTRETWRRLRSSVPMMLDEATLAELRGANEPMSLAEVEDVYLPLVRLINLHVHATRGIARVTDDFVGRPPARRPYVIAIAGSVGVGKSTVARLLQALLGRWPDHPRVALITTDGFLWPRAKLIEDGLMTRKGFPESYDLRRMIDFLAVVRSGGLAQAPVYSHVSYDIVPETFDTVEGPDILIFEGLNVLQIGDGLATRRSPVFAAADFFDLSIYIDAEPTHIEDWYVERFLLLQQTRMMQPQSYFRHVADMQHDEATSFARNLWNDVNLPNLMTNILPTRLRADVVVHKAADHSTDYLLLRRF